MSDLNLFVPQRSESHRQKRVAEEIRHLLATVIMRGDLPAIRSQSGAGFITLQSPVTLTRVEISPDLKHATVYLTAMVPTDEAKTLAFFKQQRGYLRKVLAKEMQLRYAPDLHFKTDDELKNADHILKRIADVIAEDERRTHHDNIDSEA